MPSKKKSTKRSSKPAVKRGHINDTHTVNELRSDGRSVFVFTKEDKRLLGAGLGAMLGAMLGLVIAEKPESIANGYKGLVEAAAKVAEADPQSWANMMSVLGIKVGTPSAGSAGPAIPNEAVLFDVWSSKEAPAPLGGGDGVWFERRDVAIWRTSSDGTRHAFALAFDGATPSACGQASDTATSPLFEIKGVCGSCQSILTDHGYKPPRMGAPPPPGPQPVDADFTPGPKRRKRTRKAKTTATASE